MDEKRETEQTENDGRNERQLAAAGLADYVEHFVLERLWEAREPTNQWPAETTINALALWLMWFTTDFGTFHSPFTNPLPTLILSLQNG